MTKSTNYEEAELLLNAAANFVKNWPLEWGHKDLSKVCLMATTANQVKYSESILIIRINFYNTILQQNVLRNALRHSKIKSWLVDDNGKNVDIRKAYDMQGIIKYIFLSYV